MSEHYYAVIMAGGGGTRLWPLSRQSCPKQLLRLIDNRTLFQTTVDRLEGLFAPEQVFVVSVENQVAALQRDCPHIPSQNYLIEPGPKGTASVVGLAAVAMSRLDPQAVMAVLPADHIIHREDSFLEILYTAYEVALEDYLVTLGITPTYPATGYGYIQKGNQIGVYRDNPAFRVLRFKEKPDASRAVIMLQAGDHLWNSGMFIWKASRVLEEITQQMPGLAVGLQRIAASWGTSGQTKVIEEVWSGLEEQTIDYGVMEGAQKVAVVPASDLGWHDVGSWDSLFNVLPVDEHGNLLLGGSHIAMETNNSLVYSSDVDRLIVTIGINDVIVVDTGDVLLVCDKGQAQKIRQVVKDLHINHGGYI
ncbi:MAG: sugar phosphate nucleotidyltransferase [Chloroflexota bacterium]